MTKTLFHSLLAAREFSSHLFNVPDLLEWAKLKRLHLPTNLSIEGYEFVQVEALLCAIEAHLHDLTPEQADEIVANDPVLKNYPHRGVAPWLIGADAHKKWRDTFTDAVQAGELVLLDFGSKLPIKTGTPQRAPAPDTAKAAPVVADGASVGVETAKAGPVDKAPAHEPQAAKAGPRFSMTKAALIASHEHEWPSIRVDIAGAADNELKAAKAGPRGWYEDIAMEWARAKGKLNTPVKPANELVAAVHNMANVPSRRHILKD